MLQFMLEPKQKQKEKAAALAGPRAPDRPRKCEPPVFRAALAGAVKAGALYEKLHMMRRYALFSLIACSAALAQSLGAGMSAAPTESDCSDPAAMLQNSACMQQAAGSGQGSVLSIPQGMLRGRTVTGAATLGQSLANQTSPGVGDQQANPLWVRQLPPITDETEFQKFAEDAVGHTLNVYGRSLFDLAPSTFAPLNDAPVPAAYALGTGDELLIQLWGKVDLNLDAVVDRNGQIWLPKVGAVTVAGLQYGELQGFLRKQFAALYKDFEINVALGKLRSMQIFVLGNARQPGAYTLSAMSTLLDALFASGGPSAEGSMRRIELRRQGKAATVFDLYDVEQNGDKSRDERLLAGDEIFIPPIGPQVALEGSVEQPGIYELKANETLGALLDGSGGLTEIASTEHVVLERVQDRTQLQVEAFDLTDSARRRILRDGDIVRISPLISKFKEEVTIRGNLAWPGRYPWHEGMRVSDLVPNRGALLTRDYWTQHNHMADQQNLVAVALAAKSSDSLSNPDSVANGECPAPTQYATAAGPMANSGPTAATQIPFAQSNSCALQDSGAMQGSGANQNPGDARLGTQLAGAASGPWTVWTGSVGKAERAAAANRAAQPGAEGQSVLSGQPGAPASVDLLSGLEAMDAEINWNYAVIERLDNKDLSTRLIRFNLGKAIDHPGSEDDPLLKSGDIVTIFSRNDIPLPVEQQAIFVSVSGEVNAPGVYRMASNETLRDIVRKAGGLTDHAYLFGSRLNRPSAKAIEQEQLQISIQRMKNEILYEGVMAGPTNLQSTASASVLGQAAQAQQINTQADMSLINQLAAFEPTGRVVLGIRPEAHDIDDIPDLTVENGDVLVIPPIRSTVEVSGEVYNPSSLRYRSGRRLEQYLNDSGGPTRMADVKRMLLIRADGTVISMQSHQHDSRNFKKLVLMPGDAVVVPPQIRRHNVFLESVEPMIGMLAQTTMMGAIIANLQ